MNSSAPDDSLSSTHPGISDADFSVALHVLKQAVDATSCGIVITDPHQPDNPIIYHNGTFERLTGYGPEDIVGKNCRFLQSADTDTAAVDILRAAIKNCTDCQVTLLNYRKDGTTFWNELYMSPVLEPRTGRLTHFIGVQNDVTGRVAAELERDAVLAREKRVSETLQNALMHLPGPPLFAGFDMDVLYRAAWDEARIGGDFSDTFALPSGETAFVVGDVAGKGLAAATYTGQIKFALRVFLRDEPRADRALDKLNQYLFTAQRLDSMSQYALVSVAIAVVNGATGAAQFATAGAEPPLFLPADAQQSTAPEAQYATGEGPLLGVLDDAEYDVREFQLRPGDAFVLFTDGVTEARNPHHRRGSADELLFGAERVKNAVAPVAQEPLPIINQTLYDAALGYAQGRLHDDVCIMSVRYAPR